MDELDFIGRNTQSDQFVFYVLIYVPFMGLVSAEVTENKLCTLVLCGTDIILIDDLCTSGSLVFPVITEFFTQKAHIQSHLPCNVSRNQHLCLFQIVGWQCIKPQIIPFSAVGKGYKVHYHVFLFNGRFV